MKTKQLVLVSFLIALTIIGGHVKVFGSIALDLAPSMVGTLLLNPVLGMFLAFSGHLISALIAGFPLTLPVHLIISVMMSLTMFVYGKIRVHNTNKKTIIILSDIVAFVFNVFIAQLPLIPLLGLPILASLTPALALASILNIITAELVYHAIPTTITKRVGI
ncbi:ECF transporter S component [Aerococcaceae bacterium WGS1372]